MPPSAPVSWRAAALLPALVSLAYVLVAIHVNVLVAPHTVGLDVRARAVPVDDVFFVDDPSFRANTYLRDHVSHLSEGAVRQQETPVHDPRDGSLYLFEADGWLTRLRAPQADDEGPHINSVDVAPHRVMYVGGRVLGAAFIPSTSRIVACDVAKGLVEIDIDTGGIQVLSVAAPAHPPPPPAQEQDPQAPVELVPFRFIDDLDISSDGGVVYFTDASDMQPYRMASGRWTTKELSLLDFHRGFGTGRLLAYDTRTRTTRTLLSNLYFANGVALASDDSFVLVAETFNARILRYWLKGRRTGQSEIFAEVPAVPDGISRAADGGFYVACPSTISPLFAIAARFPLVRLLVGNLPSFLWPPTPKVGLVLKLHGNGAPAYALHDKDGERVWFVTAVTEVPARDGGHYLYLGQLSGNSLPRVRAPATTGEIWKGS
jgi:sugar lactone lactonase YvrE